MLTDRESDVRIEIIRLHGDKVLAGHGAEVDRGNHDLFPSALRSPGRRLVVGVMRCWNRDIGLSEFHLGRAPIRESVSQPPDTRLWLAVKAVIMYFRTSITEMVNELLLLTNP